MVIMNGPRVEARDVRGSLCSFQKALVGGSLLSRTTKLRLALVR